MFKKAINLVTIIAFIASLNASTLSTAFAQTALSVQEANLIGFTPKFSPVNLKGLVLNPENPFKMDFIVDQGDELMPQEELKDEVRRIADFFLAALTTPQKDIWVNLSPFEHDRIVVSSFGETHLGQTLLEQDYMLKQVMATALYPERELGREFWAKVYKQAREKFGVTNVTFNTFNKVWIVPEQASVYKNPAKNSVIVVDSSLNVLLEQDYLAEHKGRRATVTAAQDAATDASKSATDVSALSAQVIREIVLPALKKEVNEGRNFAPLRQVYHTLILAKWYKQNLANSVLTQAYADRNKTAGIVSDAKDRVAKIYSEYVKTYRRGTYNFIKEEVDEANGTTVARKYFSGGFSVGNFDINRATSNQAMTSLGNINRALLVGILVTAAAVQPPAASAQTEKPGATYKTLIKKTPKTPQIVAIEAVANGKGTKEQREAAAQLFRTMGFDARAVELAARILRIIPEKGGLDGTLNAGFSFPTSTIAEINASGLAANIVTQLKNYFGTHRNVGSSSLRLEAAAYLQRHAASLSSSNGWQKLFDRGFWESLADNDEGNPNVRTARLLALASLYDLGKESRFGNNVLRIEKFLMASLASNLPQERLAAIALLSKLDDPRAESLILLALKNGTTMEDFQKLLAAVNARGMVTAQPALLERFKQFADSKPRTPDPTQTERWYAEMNKLLNDVAESGKADPVAFMANLRHLSKDLTADGSGRTVNSVYISLLYVSMQNRWITVEKFREELNRLRELGGLEPMAADIRQSTYDPTVNLGRAINQLRNNRDQDKNAELIVTMGAPSFVMEALLDILKDTTNPETMAAIVRRMPYLRDFRVDPVVDEFENILTVKMADNADPTNTLPLDILRTVADANLRMSDSFARAVIQYALSRPNNVGSIVTNVDQEPSLQAIRLAARVLVQSRVAPEYIERQIKAAPQTLGLSVNVERLIAAINAIRNETSLTPTTPSIEGEKPTVEVTEVSWKNAENLLRTYIVEQDKVTLEQVVAAINAANKVPFSGLANDGFAPTVLGKIADASSREFSSPASIRKMANVFAALGNLGFGYLQSLMKLQNPQVDSYVLIAIKNSTATEKEGAAENMVRAYLHYAGLRILENPQSLTLADRMLGEIAAAASSTPSLIKEIRTVIANTAGTVSPQQALLLNNWGSINGSYTASVRVLATPSSSVAAVNAALDSLNNTRLPPFAKADFDHLEAQGRMGRQEIFPRWSIFWDRVHRMAGATVSGEDYRRRVDAMRAQIQQIEHPNDILSIMRSSLSLPGDTAGELFMDLLDGSRSVRNRYPNFKDDVSQYKPFFGLLQQMRLLVLEKSTPTFRRELVAFLTRRIMMKQYSSARYEHPEVFIFLLSLLEKADQQKLTDIMLPGIVVKETGNGPLRNEPPARYKTARAYLDSQNLLEQRLTELARALPPEPSQQFTVDPLTMMAVLYDPVDNPLHQVDGKAARGSTANDNLKLMTRQMMAAKGLGKLLLLTVKDKQYPNVTMELYKKLRLSQMRLNAGVEDPRIDPRGMQSAVDHVEQILYAETIAGSLNMPAMSQKRALLRENSNDDGHLIKDNPAALYVLIKGIARTRDVSLVRDMLNFGWPLINIWTRNHPLGTAVYEAIVDIGSTFPDETSAVVYSYIKQLERMPGTATKIQQLKNILGEIATTKASRGLGAKTANKAMLSNPDRATITDVTDVQRVTNVADVARGTNVPIVPDVNGGIDLNAFNVREQGEEFKNAWPTAVRDQVQALLNANGLKPVVATIRSLDLNTLIKTLGL